MILFQTSRGVLPFISIRFASLDSCSHSAKLTLLDSQMLEKKMISNVFLPEPAGSQELESTHWQRICESPAEAHISKALFLFWVLGKFENFFYGYALKPKNACRHTVRKSSFPTEQLAPFATKILMLSRSPLSSQS